MKLTAQVKLLPSPKQADTLGATMKRTNAAANWLSKRAFEGRHFHRYALQHTAYYETRERFELGAEMTVRVIAKVCDAYKNGRSKARQFRPTGAVKFNHHILSFGAKDTISIWTLNGRERMPFVVGKRQRVLLATRKGEVTLVARRDGFYLMVPCEVEGPTQLTPNGWLGVDLGVVNIATDSDGECHTGAELVGLRKRHQRQRARMSRKGTKSAKRRLRQRSGKEARLARDINHCISKRIVREAERTGRGIALEDLKGIRGRIRARRSQRRTLHSWAFHQLGSFIEYKAALAGVPVVMIDPAMTSRTCPECGHCAKANRPQRDNFTCRRCGLAGPADHIAARNIAGRAAAVQPHAEPSGASAS